MSNRTSEIMSMHDVIAEKTVVYNHKVLPIGEALDRALADIAYKAARYRKPGGVTFHVDLKPGSMNRMTLSTKLEVKEPKPDAMASEVYVDNSGQLFGEDPDQMRLAFPDATVVSLPNAAPDMKSAAANDE